MAHKKYQKKETSIEKYTIKLILHPIWGSFYQKVKIGEPHCVNFIGP
jgi:hypothetical protein